MRDWSYFASLLPIVASARYRQPGQVPDVPGDFGVASKFVGTTYTNCTMFDAWLVARGFGVKFTLAQWKRWQVYDYDPGSPGYGPGVCAEMNLGYPVDPADYPSSLKGGVYLFQTFHQEPQQNRPDTWGGHSGLVLDCAGDGLDDKILILEANTARVGLDGVGFRGLGPIRSTNAGGWRTKSKTTRRSMFETSPGHSRPVRLVKLYIDHDSVLRWLAAQE